MLDPHGALSYQITISVRRPSAPTDCSHFAHFSTHVRSTRSDVCCNGTLLPPTSRGDHENSTARPVPMPVQLSIPPTHLSAYESADRPALIQGSLRHCEPNFIVAVRSPGLEATEDRWPESDDSLSDKMRPADALRRIQIPHGPLPRLFVYQIIRRPLCRKALSDKPPFTHGINLGFFKRFLSLGSSKSKKNKKKQNTAHAKEAVDAEGRILPRELVPQDPDTSMNRLLRSSSTKFSVMSAIDYASLPPLRTSSSHSRPARLRAHLRFHLRPRCSPSQPLLVCSGPGRTL
ncbi:hypothetical protein NUW54_g14257 [Trametes sanguinea]|uniref:Uncharacterized protein n=1 Tax=Trametes sanguinea TaxID=158606 RepID=A0ACC1ME41_9APHY|nr:hypothetical protein NUW54_g14257 [Trametes sanguinea]